MKFGSPSSNRTTQPQGTSEWANLLKQTASDGLSSAFGGGFLGAIGGLGGLVSSIAGLFGGSKQTQAPLTLFELPTAQSNTVLVHSNKGASSPGSPNSGDTAGSNQQITSSFNQNQHQPYQYQSSQIAQAVKQALLNSSSLNDVIAEI
ncbi:MAG: hypothetical protein M3Y72_11190 [Acidobacteriota bacterium]|nr:hypothetical protein [Acidobacteriota bacterium]